MIRQHKRRYTRALGWILSYCILFVFSLISIIDMERGTWIKVLYTTILICIGVAIFLLFAKRGVFNRVIFSDSDIKIEGYKYNRTIEWNKISSIRILSEEYDVDYGLEERYYGIYYMHDGEECKELISYNDETDREIRKYYKKMLYSIF